MSISGYHNYNEPQQIAFARMKKALQEVFSRYGYAPFTPRPVELIENLQVGGVGHQVYQLARMEDGGTTKVGLPYDRTIQLATWIAQHANEIIFPYKRLDVGLSWRGETPQLGRLRAFFQADIDTIEPNLGPLADTECLAAIYHAVKALGVDNFVIKVNHMGILKGVLRNSLKQEGEKLKKTLQLIDKLDKLSVEEVVKAICDHDQTLDAKKVSQLISSLKYAGPFPSFSPDSSWDDETKSAYIELTKIVQQLILFQVDLSHISFSPTLARGLDYYTGMVFETDWIGNEAFGSIASGGRYDNLVTGFSGPNGKALAGVGGSVGLSRIFDIFCKATDLQSLERRSDADIVISFQTDAEMEKAITIAQELRKAGKKVDLYLHGDTKLGEKLNYAHKKGVPFALMIFDHEIVIRDMFAKTQLEFATLQEALNYFLTGQETFQELIEI